MKILITGNICSGKSTIARELAKKLDIDHVELDEYRRKNNKAKTKSGEEVARAKFMKRCEDKKSAVVELTGTGGIGDWALHQARMNGWRIVTLECSLGVINKRVAEKFELKKYKWPPLPREWGKDFEGTQASVLRAVMWMDSNLPKLPGSQFLRTDTNTADECVMKIIKSIAK